MWLIFRHQQFISYSVDLNWLLFIFVLRVVLNIPWLQQFFHSLTHNQTQMAQHTPFIYKEDKDRKSFNHGGLSSIIIQWSHYIARPPSRVSSNGVFNLLIMNRMWFIKVIKHLVNAISTDPRSILIIIIKPISEISFSWMLW